MNFLKIENEMSRLKNKKNYRFKKIKEKNYFNKKKYNKWIIK